jgi:hypothetical protein
MAEEITTIGELPDYAGAIPLDTTLLETEDQSVPASLVARKISAMQLMQQVRHATFGSANYQDTLTVGTPIVGIAGVPYALTNNAGGAQVYDDLPPTVTPLWIAGTSSFDFSSLNPVDILRIRVDIEVTTTVANQEAEVYLELGQGGFSYSISLASLVRKVAGPVQISEYTMIYMGDSNTIDNSGQIKVVSASATSTVVRGWALDVDLKTF